jgi:hypothetical protein
MNTNNERATTRGPRGVRARRVATLSVAGLLAGLALAPAGAYADHPTSPGNGSAATPTGDRWSYLYDVAQRKEAMARERVAHAAPTSTEASGTTAGYVNPWSYMYDVDDGAKQVVHSRVPLAKARRDSVPQRKAHPALARIVVSVSKKAPATCYLPDSVDPGTRRLIAVQLCGKAHIVPAVFLDRAAYYEQAYSLGHL